MADSKGDGGPAIGIDLGTTYSCVAVWRVDRAEVIANDQGNRLTPSCVAFTGAERLVGEAAVNQAALNPCNTIFGKNWTQAVSVIFFCRHKLWIRVVSLICVTDRSAVSTRIAEVVMTE
ncbi:unnamed protein product [Urochloa humidicola]